MKESKYSSKVTDYLNSIGAVVDNNTASVYSKVGRSDLTVLYKGYYFALELKTGNYQPTPLQIEYLKDIRANGGIGLVLRDNLDNIKEIVYSIDNELPIIQPELPKIKADLGIIYD